MNINSLILHQKFLRLFICAFIIFASNARSVFAEFKGELYRSVDHQFRIKFPVGWSIQDGDGPNVIKKAVSKDGASILIRVTNLPNNFPVDSISDLSPDDQKELCDGLIEGYVEGLEISFPGSTVLSTEYSTLDNHKAVDIKSSSLHSSVGSSATMILRTFATVHNKKNYGLVIAAEQNMYAPLEGIMLASARTFVFEDGYDQSGIVEDKKKADVFAIENQ